MQAKITVKKLKNLWSKLDELGLSALLTGGDFKISNELISKLLIKDELKNIIVIITDEPQTNFDDLDLQKVVKILQDFFTDFGTLLKNLMPTIAQ